MKPLLTILTITKDDASGLDATIVSVRVWENLPWVENVVVYAGKRPDVTPEGWRVFEQAGTGIAEAFNECLSAAKGEWVWGALTHDDMGWMERHGAPHSRREAIWAHDWRREAHAAGLRESGRFKDLRGPALRLAHSWLRATQPRHTSRLVGPVDRLLSRWI